MAIDPTTLKTKFVEHRRDGSIAGIVGHEDLFPLTMTLDRSDGFLEGGDWVVVTSAGTREHDGLYRTYQIEWDE